MRTVLSKILFVTAVTILSLSAFDFANATEEININLRIEGPEKTIVNQEINVPESCVVEDSSGATTTFSGYKAICALQSALENNLIESFQISPTFFIDKINEIENDTQNWSEFWIVKKNNNNSDLGIAEISLKEENIINNLFLAYGEWSQDLLDINVTTNTIYLGESLDLQSLIWKENSFVENTNPVNFYINDSPIESTIGKLSWLPNSIGTFHIYIDNNKFVKSKNINIDVLQKNIYNLKINTTTTTPTINTSTTLYIYEENIDENLKLFLSKSTSSTLVINNIELFNEDGIYELPITTTTPYTIYAKKEGFITSEITIINPTEDIAEEDKESENNNYGGSGGSINVVDNTPTSAQITEAANKILNYFKTQQAEDGSILDGGTSDWIAMSFGANGQYAKDIKNAISNTTLFDYIYNYNFTDPSDMNLCVAYPRHILALLASGVAKTDNKIIDLKNKINNENCYQNSLYGQTGINDDIFALLSLSALDYDINSQIISDIKNTILSDQNSNGAFTWTGYPGADVTGAVINALDYGQSKGLSIESSVITNAKNYLKSTQLSDGGWGYETSDVLTTSWSMLGINSLNENMLDWKTNKGYNPKNILIDNLQNDGSYDTSWNPGTVDWFGLKHAVPSLLGKTWPIILDPIIQPTNNVGGGSIETNTTSTTATSTEEIVTSTPEIIDDIATSTQKQKIEILPIILELPVENIQTTKTPIAETKLTKQSLIAKNNLEQVLGEKTETTSEDKIIEEEKQNIQTNETIEKTKENEDKNLPTNKKVALGLGAASLLYGLYLLFKLFA